MYLFLIVLSLCCAWAFSSWGGHGLSSLQCSAYCSSFSCFRASEVSRGWDFSSCGTWAPEHRLSSCDCMGLVVPQHGIIPEIEPMSAAFAGGFVSTAPPGKSRNKFYNWVFITEYLVRLGWNYGIIDIASDE